MRYRFAALIVAALPSLALVVAAPDHVTGHPGGADLNRHVGVADLRVRATRAQTSKPKVFDNADLRGRDFTDADLDGARFQLAQLQGANFTRARVRGVVFEGAQLDDARFVHAQLQGAQFATATLAGADFTGADLESADLGDQLHGAKLARTNLVGVLFGFGVETQLQGADLGGARLTGADLAGAQLQGANLKSANLQGADLREANLQGADLGQADLRGANLAGALLQGASLRGTKVWHTLGPPVIDLADIDAVETRESTRMTPREINGIVTTFQEPFRKDARKRLAVLNPAVRIGAKDLTDAKVWTKTTPSPKQLAEFLAKVACGLRTDKADLDNPVDTRVDAHVARGLMHNGRLAAAGDQMTIFADALRKGRADPAACPGIAGFADADWAALDSLTANIPAADGPKTAPPH